jgi:hypothetical protein
VYEDSAEVLMDQAFPGGGDLQGRLGSCRQGAHLSLWHLLPINFPAAITLPKDAAPREVRSGTIHHPTPAAAAAPDGPASAAPDAWGASRRAPPSSAAAAAAPSRPPHAHSGMVWLSGLAVEARCCCCNPSGKLMHASQRHRSTAALDMHLLLATRCSA